jgi:acyl carrier protein
MSPGFESSEMAAVRELVAEMSPLGIAEIEPHTALVAELGFDSLGLVELLIVIEDRFGLPPLEDHELLGLERVADLEALVLAAQSRVPLR